MINVLSYLGMSVQSEVCLWTILGLLRTTFDATLFKVNANLKQVWQMRMPVELSKPVQRGLRTMISGVMLVQCFTVYVYLASYIVLLYPVFLEERPTLVLPWLLLAAVRNLLCELLSLTLGLGTCLLVGPARPPCIKFLIIKIVSIMPAFYMWMLVLSYYNALKLAAAFKTFPAALPANDLDYGLELAIRRRRTKSLFGEALLRTRLITNLDALYVPRPLLIILVIQTYLFRMAYLLVCCMYTDKQTAAVEKPAATQENVDVLSETEGQINSRNETDDSNILATDLKSKVEPTDDLRIQSDIDIIGINQTNRLLTLSDLGPFMYEDCFGNEIPVPRNADRINEQFGLMLLRISAYLKKDKSDQFKFLETDSLLPLPHPKDQNLGGPNLTDEPDTPPLVASSKGNMASYLRDYPQIFMKKTSDLQLQQKLDSMRAVQSQIGDNNETTYNDRKQIDFEKTTTTETTISHKKIGKQTETSQRKSLETIDSTLLMQGYNEVTEDVNLNPQNNLTATNSGMNKSSSDSLSSIIARMKTHLSEAKSSKKRNNNNVSSSQTFSSSRTSSKERKQYQKRKID